MGCLLTLQPLIAQHRISVALAPSRALAAPGAAAEPGAVQVHAAQALAAGPPRSVESEAPRSVQSGSPRNVGSTAPRSVASDAHRSVEAATPRSAESEAPGNPEAATPRAESAAPRDAGGEEAHLTLEAAMAIALAENRTLLAARMRHLIAEKNVAVAAARPNPDLILEAARDTPHEALSLAFPFETALKRRRRIALSEAGVRRDEAETLQAASEVRSLVRRAYFALSVAQLRVSQAADARANAERAHEAAQARFDEGDAPRLEVVQTELSVAQAENEAELAVATLVSERSRLDVLLARPPDAPLTVSEDLSAGTVPPVETAQQKALEGNTELTVLERRITEAEARVALARAQQYPDPVVQGGVTYDAPPDFTYGWKAGLTLTLPLFTRHRAEVLVEDLTLAQLRAEREALEARVRGDVFAALSLASAQRDQYLRYKDWILPQVEEVERLADDSYRSGQTGLLVLLQALQSAREVRAKAVQAGFDYQVALADLERAIGAPLP